MKNNERRLYQNNDLGYLLVIISVAFNAVYSVLVLNAKTPDRALGVFVMLTIALLLLGFLTAIKVRVYSITWSVIASLIGLFQFSRFFFTNTELEASPALWAALLLFLSGAFILTSGALSYISARLRMKAAREATTMEAHS